MIKFCKSWWLIGVGVALFAMLASFEAQAVNEGHWPQTVVDTNCTDTNDTPAAAGQVGARPQPQTTGTADGFCDHDSRIDADPITADTTYGPFRMSVTHRSIVLFVDADTVLPLATSTWNVRILEHRPHDDTVREVHAILDESSEGDTVFLFAPSGFTYGTATQTINGEIPAQFFIELNLNAATSWDGSISWKPF